MIPRGRPLLAAAVVLASCGVTPSFPAVGGDGPSPSSAPPAPSASSPESPPPTDAPGTPNASIAGSPSSSNGAAAAFTRVLVARLGGWRLGKLVVELIEYPASPLSSSLAALPRASLLEFDPVTEGWSRISLPPPFDQADGAIATDGESVALLANGRLIVIDAEGRRHLLMPDGDPPVTSSWGLLGLTPRPQGGYVVRGVERLYDVKPGPWRIEDVRIPPRYVVVAPTNDRQMLVLAPDADRLQPASLDDPFRLTIWAPQVPVLARLQTHPRTWRVDPSATGLVYARTLRGWVLLDDVAGSGVVEQPVSLPPVPGGDRQFQSLSRDGRLVSIACAGDAVRLPELRGGCTVTVSAGSLVMAVDEMAGETIYGVAWSPDDRLAVLAGPDDPGAAARLRLVVESERGAPIVAEVPAD